MTLDGYLALPDTGTGPGVLVLHAWWGLNDTIKSVCARLAEAGFVAFAPDLYHGQIARTIAEAEVLSQAIDADPERASAKVAQAALFIHQCTGAAAPGLAVIGFSLGGFFALQLAATHPEHIRSVVLFYGTEGTMGQNFSASSAEFLGHFAENDPYEPPSNVEALEHSLRRAGCSVTFHTYPGTGHWFFEPDRTEAYDAAAAQLAWDRTLNFLKRLTMTLQPEPTLVELIRYNNWANAQIIAACQKLTPDQLDATAPGTYGTIRDTLVHIIRSEADYIGRITGQRPQPPFRWEDNPSIDDMAAFAEQVAIALLDVVQRTPPTQMVHEEENGLTMDYQVRHLFIQVINHGIEHRTNITTILAGVGVATPEVDGWGYLFAHPDRFQLKEGRLGN